MSQLPRGTKRKHSGEDAEDEDPPAALRRPPPLPYRRQELLEITYDKLKKTEAEKHPSFLKQVTNRFQPFIPGAQILLVMVPHNQTCCLPGSQNQTCSLPWALKPNLLSAMGSRTKLAV